MKLFSILLLLAVSQLCSGQPKSITIVKQGLCDVKNMDCIQQPNKNKEGHFGWIEISKPTIKIYYSGNIQKIELVADLELTEVVSNNNSYQVYEGFQKLTPYTTTLPVIVRIEFPSASYNRMVIYYYDPTSTFGNYYICK